MADGYGLRADTLKDIIRAHKLARRSENTRQLQSIEEALTDLNYHTIRDLLHSGDYDKAAELHRTHTGKGR